MVTKIKILKGDTVRVLRGKDRGKKAQVMAVFPATNKVMVEGINLVKKHVKAKRAGQKGQRVTVAAPLPVSNVQVVCGSCKKGTRVRIVREGKARQRQCIQCQTELTVPKVS